MADNDIDMGFLLRVEPKIAVDYMRSKGYNITWNWHEQLEEAHAKAFTVAKVAKAEVLELINEHTIEAISEGWSFKEYQERLTPLLQQKGWWGKKTIINDFDEEETVQFGSPYRLKTIFETNKRVAFHVGRYARQMANIDHQPYWEYVSMRDTRTRKSHLALNGIVYKATDPIWEHIYPPNDWRCRCQVNALSEFELRNRGLVVANSEGMATQEEIVYKTDRNTGEEYRTKVTRLRTPSGKIFTTGAGWNHNPGKAALGNDVATIRKLQQIKNRDLRSQAIQAINNSEARHNAFSSWVKSNLGKLGASARYICAGFVSTEIAEKVTALSGGQKRSELVLVMSEKRLAHADSDKHHEIGTALTVDEYATIPKIIANPAVVVWDKEHQNLIYINQDKTIKVVVDAPNKDKLKPQEKLDAIINSYKVDYVNFKAMIEKGIYQVIQGIP